MATATLQITGGPSFVFAESAGTDAGSFVDPEGQFTQHCIKVERTDTPVAIFFRRDAVTNRFEVVAENFKMWRPAQAAQIGPFTLTITDDNGVNHVLAAPQWWYGSRFRYNPTPRPVRHTLAELISQGLIANYVNPPIPFKEQYVLDNYVYRNPMDRVAYGTDFSTTGERPEIGWDNDVIATAIFANRTDVILNCAESAASVPMHFRDEQTGAPINFIQYPKAQWYDPGQSDTPFVQTGGQPVSAAYPWNFTEMQAHMPNFGSFIAAMLTGDPFHIEECQFAFNADIGWTSYWKNADGTRSIPEPQTRGVGWASRDGFQAGRATPPGVPSWLLPQSVIKQFMANYHNHVRNDFTLSTDPVRTRFSVPIHLAHAKPWEESFIGYAWCRGVQLGFPEWLQDATWKVQHDLAQVNGTSGWDPQFDGEYEFDLGVGPFNDNNDPMAGWVPAANWGQVWSIKAATNALYTAPRSDSTSFGSAILPNGVAPAYANYRMGVMAVAADLGILGAAAGYAWISRQMFAANCAFVLAKWSVAPRASVSVPAPAPAPTPTPTPTPTLHVFEEAILEDGVPVLKWPIKPHT